MHYVFIQIYPKHNFFSCLCIFLLLISFPCTSFFLSLSPPFRYIPLFSFVPVTCFRSHYSFIFIYNQVQLAFSSFFTLTYLSILFTKSHTFLRTLCMHLAPTFSHLSKTPFTILMQHILLYSISICCRYFKTMPPSLSTLISLCVTTMHPSFSAPFLFRFHFI